MISETRKEFLETLEQMPPARIRAQLDSGWLSLVEQRAWAYEYLAELDRNEQWELRSKEADRANKALELSARSAEASEESASAAKWAAAIALATTVAAVLKDLFPWIIERQ